MGVVCGCVLLCVVDCCGCGRLLLLLMMVVVVVVVMVVVYQQNLTAYHKATVALEAERKARELERLEKSKKQSMFGKLFGGADAEPVTIPPPVAPVKPLGETRVSFQVSCWDKVQALHAAKLIIAAKDAMSLLHG